MLVSNSISSSTEMKGVLPQIDSALTVIEKIRQGLLKATEPITVSTWNMRYSTGLNGHDRLNQLVTTGVDGQPPSDIVLLQEVEWRNMGNLIHRTKDTHSIFVGQGQYGGFDGEFSPILYNHSKFDAIYTEHVQLHGDGYAGAGRPRIANFVLLKDKSTGATVLVVNAHLDHISEEARRVGLEVIQRKIDEIKAKMPVDSVMFGGDLNGANPLGDISPREDFTPQGTGFRGLDYLGLTGTAVWGKAMNIADGNPSDHDIYSSTFFVVTSKDSAQDRLGYRDVNGGVLLYDDVPKYLTYSGEFWLFGFGAPGSSDWNDRVSGFYVSPGYQLTARFHSDRDDRFNTDNPSAIYSGYVPWVGDSHNDQYSYLILEPAMQQITFSFSDIAKSFN